MPAGRGCCRRSPCARTHQGAGEKVWHAIKDEIEWRSQRARPPIRSASGSAGGSRHRPRPFHRHRQTETTVIYEAGRDMVFRADGRAIGRSRLCSDSVTSG
jgi:hypothetical protein